MNIDKKTIDELKEKLLQEKNKLEEDLGRISEPDKKGEYKTKFEELGEEADENASEVTMYGNTLAVEENLEKQLKAVKNSLEKIEDGSYGKCEECEGDIRIERLKINPSAKRCMQCAK